MMHTLQICEMEPGLYRECDSLVRNMQGRLEILSVSVQAEGETSVDHYDEHEDLPSKLLKPSSDASQQPRSTITTEEPADSMLQLSEKMQKQSISTGNSNTEGGEEKRTRCSTCNTLFGDSKQYREHCKSDWHKHNLKRKTRKLPPLTAEECLADMDMDDSKADLKDYSF